MTNKQIANHFNLLGKLMELHGENPFKIRSYYSAYQKIRRLDQPLAEMAEEEWASLPGIGKAIQGKIGELVQNGNMSTLQKYIEMTPPGVIEILGIKGLGPKKVLTIWKEMEVESPGELLYACNENRLVEMKGFGEKTQADVIKKINFYMASKGQYLYGAVDQLAESLLTRLQEVFEGERFAFVGGYQLKLPILDGLHILTTLDDLRELEPNIADPDFEEIDGILSWHGIPVEFTIANDQTQFAYDSIITDTPELWRSQFEKVCKKKEAEDQKALFQMNNLVWIPPELRDYPDKDLIGNTDLVTNLVTEEDIKGVVHCHTKYSDGLYSVEEMAKYSQELGYKYIVITDHSRAAFYANGLSIERVAMQQREIDEVNQKLDGIHIMKGIECDILNDGSMDYPDDIMAEFDLVIASIHSNLKMKEEKAMLRLIGAIEHPHVKMLGHMTGRLLLSREGYPVNHEKIIDACAANGVCIELNANPHRLDIDYKWINKAQKKGVLISINPDAHNKEGIHDIKYGVIAARKGGLSVQNCLNSLGKDAFLDWLSK